MPDLPEKEILNNLFDEKKEYSVTETEIEPKIDKEVQPLIHAIEQNATLTKTVTDDYGQTLVSPPAPVSPKIVMPISRNKYAYGLTQKVTASIRWLAEWCGRLLKIFGQRAEFHEGEVK